MRRPDAIVSLLLLGISSYVFYETASYPEPIVPGSPGPALYPRVVASLIAVSSVALFVQSVRETRRNGTPAAPLGLARMWLSVSLIMLFLFIAPHWDTFVLLPLLMSSIMAIMGERRFKTILATALVFDLFVYVVFYRVFGVPLPTVYF